MFCASISNRVTLDGKEQDLAAVRTILAAKWTVLQAAYEKEKKVDPDFAIPPSEDALPKAVPNVVWQVGHDKWHVDAGVAVTPGKVYAASAFLDDEKTGERALVCLDAADGKPIWKAPLRLNPWGGPTLAGDLALVACSSIRFDPKQLSGALGEVVAVRIADGSVAWRMSVPGGVVSAIAVSGSMAVFTATDGNVRAYDVANGSEKWTYRTRSPFFAGVAIAGGVVYAADLSGVVHAVDLGVRPEAVDAGPGPRSGRSGPRQRCMVLPRARRAALRRHVQPRCVRRKTSHGGSLHW